VLEFELESMLSFRLHFFMCFFEILGSELESDREKSYKIDRLHLLYIIIRMLNIYLSLEEYVNNSTEILVNYRTVEDQVLEN